MARTTDMSETIDRLLEIKETIKELVNEAYESIPEGMGRNAAYGYWYAHILGALDEDSPFCGGSMIRMQDTIDGLGDEGDEEGGDS